jgi:hypothetical protein
MTLINHLYRLWIHYYYSINMIIIFSGLVCTLQFMICRQAEIEVERICVGVTLKA